LEKYFHALFILKPLLDKVQYWLESNFIVCKCSWQIVLGGGGRVFYIFLYLHRMILSSLPYKNMLLLQLLLDMIHHFDKLDCHMVKLEKRQQKNSTTIDNAYTFVKFKKKKSLIFFICPFNILLYWKSNKILHSKVNGLCLFSPLTIWMYTSSPQRLNIIWSPSFFLLGAWVAYLTSLVLH
jgi:hypothetical protein